MMRDQRPYLLRALYEWIVDSSCTPYLQIHTHYPGVVAPAGFDDDGVLVLNISASATNRFHMGDQSIDFEARFRGTPMAVHIPVAAVLAIFAKETGEGMQFPMPNLDEAQQQAELSVVDTPAASDAVVSTVEPAAKPKRERGHLRVIK